ncbi:unnamed protein product [Peronospora destructor]|uniref:Uncharacterized protein n=1 Tax=Peronospora destructor TaxID=86335 RepID=A0AAV0VBQ0_9STRA|nr:unnamed protein product [Peronospora destructor]
MEMTSPPSSSSSQRHIWFTRVHRELEKCRIDDALPHGATLRRAYVSKTRGLCEGEFYCFVPFVDGSDALFLIPLTDLVIRMPFYDTQVTEGQVQYPFRAPEVEIRQGALYLPPGLRKRKLPKSEGEEPIFLLQLPLLEHWSPSTTLKMLLHELFQLVQQNDPAPIKSVTIPSTNSLEQNGLQKGHLRINKPMRMRKRDVHGAVYPCQEMDFATSTLKQTPMLLQTGKIALLMPLREAAAQKDDDYVYVGDLISLQDVVRITPQRGKSLTLFFKDRMLPCRTFLSQYTDEIVKDLRIMIGDTSSTKRGYGQPLSGAAGLAAQLLPFLSTDQSDKAKEMSTKLIGKLGKVATSVSRFWRGDEDEAKEQQQMDPLVNAFSEIDALKEAFYRTPSKARMTEITRRYQNIAEEYTYRNNQEGHVERTISELQLFIEHPKAQRIFVETSVYDQYTKGIRVGPA